MLCAVYAWQRYKLLSLGLFVWTAAVCLSIVYLGEHYVVDAIASIPYVVVATVIVEVVAARRRRRAAASAVATPARSSA
jgi:membrane-associated phospholipid phosphatase